MFVCYSRYDKMFRQVIIEMRLGCQKRILYHQNPVPQCHEVTSFQNTMVNTNLGRMLEVFFHWNPEFLVEIHSYYEW